MSTVSTAGAVSAGKQRTAGSEPGRPTSSDHVRAVGPLRTRHE